jgi:hypothetical protein
MGGTRAMAGVAAGLALVAAGCGGGGGSSSFADRSGQDILTAAASDMHSLKTVHFVGDIAGSSKKIHVDLRTATAGECQGSFTIGQGTAQIVASSGKAWMKPDHAFWEATAPGQAAQVEKIVGDKWVSIPLSSGLSKVCDLDNLLQKLTPPTAQESAASKVIGTSQVGGADAVQVQGKSKQGDTVDAWVATDDPHYVLKLTVADGTSPGSITFSEFDDPLDVATPAPSDVAVIPGS